MLALKDRCVSPETGKPYIKSFSGGKDNSPEGASVSLPTLQLLRVSGQARLFPVRWLI